MPHMISNSSSIVTIPLSRSVSEIIISYFTKFTEVTQWTHTYPSKVKWVTWPWLRPFWGGLSYRGYWYDIHVCTFEKSIFSRSKDMNDDPKRKTTGDLGWYRVIQGHRQCPHSIDPRISKSGVACLHVAYIVSNRTDHCWVSSRSRRLRCWNHVGRISQKVVGEFRENYKEQQVWFCVWLESGFWSHPQIVQSNPNPGFFSETLVAHHLTIILIDSR